MRSHHPPRRFRQRLLPWAAAAAIALGSTGAQAAFSINLDLSGVATTYRSYFTAAKSFWEGVITGYQPGVGLSSISISAVTKFIDGQGGVLGSAGPTGLSGFGSFVLPVSGAMTFDNTDVDALVDNGRFGDVIRHEMAHVLGFGTVWTLNHVYPTAGQFIGAAALAQYKVEFHQPAATFVPVEQEGGAGTAGGHWDEVSGGAQATGIVNPQGRDMRFELMTGWLNTPTFTSRTTIASFQDIGYAVNLSAVPEPGTLALWLLGVPLLAGWAAGRRRSA